MILVADASAAAKLVILEAGTDLVQQLWDDPVTWLAPTLIVPEVASAISAAGRAGRLQGSVDDVHGEWRTVADDIELRMLDAELAAAAREVAASHAVRGADAVYIALAHALGLDKDVVLASFDERQRGAAREGGVAVVPGEL